MEQLMKNLEEALEQIDLLTEERDKLKDRYEDSKVYIGQLKEKIEHLKSNFESTESETSDDDYSKLKMQYKILKHELKITNLKLALRSDPKKVESDLKTENLDLRANLEKKTSELELLKANHEELQKYNTIVKGELTQRKLSLEKLYSSRGNIDEQMSVQRPTYAKTSLGYLFNMSIKKPKSGSNLKEKDKYDDKIESSQPSNKYKEVGQEKENEKLDEPKQVESPKETKYEF